MIEKPNDNVNVSTAIKQELKQKGFSIIKVMFSALFVIVFVIITANITQSFSHRSDIKNDKVEAKMISNAVAVTSEFNSKLNNNATNVEENIKENFSVPRIYIDENNQIVFVNRHSDIVARINGERLKVIELFNISPDMVEGWSDIYFEGDTMEYFDDIFYFFVTVSFGCGTSNCNYVFYKYDVLSNQLTILDDKDVIGGPPKMFLSPNNKKIAILSHMHGGASCSSPYLFVFDLTTETKERITDFEDSDFSNNYIESIIWETDDDVIFSVEQCDCNAHQKGRWNRKFTYNTKSQETILIHEKFINASEPRG
ncbi:hypothetical protein D4R87_02355 [bacterium]|nr:MAG: hypothetical protein D4R87_02355 [bacterium]